MNVKAVGNFAVEICPNESVNAYCATEIFADVFVKLESGKFFLRVADIFNRRHNSFDLANHFFDGERFLRRLDRLAQELEKFFLVLHAIASKIFDKQPPKRYNANGNAPTGLVKFTELF